MMLDTCSKMPRYMSKMFQFLFQACAAYCFITVPSLQSVLAQLHLYLISGQTALLNQCHSQGIFI